MIRIGLIGENSVSYVNRLLSIWNQGACAVLIDWRIPHETAVPMLREAGVNRCYIQREQLNKIPPEKRGTIAFVPFESEAEDLYHKFCPNYSREEAVVIYSSGTTGKSKGIILSHYAINTNADAIIDYMKPSPTDCIYLAKTLSHSSTLTGELLVALKTHMRVVIAPVVVLPRHILANIEKFGVTILCLNPTLLALLAEEQEKKPRELRSLHTIYVSGSVLHDAVYEKAHRVFGDKKIYNVYGLSEAGPRVTAQTGTCCKSNSVGKPIRGVEVMIVDENGQPAEPGRHGTVHVKTESCYTGYISGKEKHQTQYKDWLNTGDIGYMDAEGELHIAGRADDVMIIDAHKIYPGEVEAAILKHTPVSECAVVKIVREESEWIGCLYVGEVSEREIRERLRTLLPTYEIPKRFLQCDTLPRTLNGKISKAEIADTIVRKIENGGSAWVQKK